MAEPIRVIVRVRPATNEEVGLEVEGEEIIVSFGREKEKTFIGRFAAVLDDASQGDLFEEVRPMVESVATGFNACVIAYGQTGSGKSWSMIGDISRDEDEGVVPRAVRSLFSSLEGPEDEWQVHCSLLQIYGERLTDLLNATSSEPLRIRETFQGQQRELYVSGQSSYRCGSADEVLSLVRRGLASRTSRATKVNENSSRSHAVLQLVVETRRETADDGCQKHELSRSKLYLVDLAGSERVADLYSSSSSSSGGTLPHKDRQFAEHVSINQSLSALGNVVAALAEGAKKRPHVPYRDSLLTRLLQDTLGGNSRTAIVACVAPDATHADETTRTLRFAERAQNVVGSVHANRETIGDGDEAALRRALRKAYAEIDRLKVALADAEHSGAPHRVFVDQAKVADECCRLREANAKLVAENAALLEQLNKNNKKNNNNNNNNNKPVVDEEVLLEEVNNADAARAMQTLLDDLHNSLPPGTTTTTTAPAPQTPSREDLRAKCEKIDKRSMFRLLDEEQDAVGTTLANECAELTRIRRERELLEAQLAELDAATSGAPTPRPATAQPVSATHSVASEQSKQAWDESTRSLASSGSKRNLANRHKQPKTPNNKATRYSSRQAPNAPLSAPPPKGLFGDGRDVGARVEVYSYRFNRSYPGEVILYDAHRKLHCVLYDTGERHWQDLEGKQVKVLAAGTGTTASLDTTPLPASAPTTPLSLSAFAGKEEGVRGKKIEKSKSMMIRRTSLAALVVACSASTEVTLSQAQCILSGKKIVFFGDSISRYCYFGLNHFLSTGSVKSSEYDSKWGSGDNSNDYDCCEGETWTDYAPLSDDETARQIFYKEFDDFETRFYFIQYVWSSDDDTDGETSMEDLASGDVEDFDILVFNQGYWQLKENDDTDQYCGEDWTSECEEDYEEDFDEVVDQLADGKTFVYRTTTCCGEADDGLWIDSIDEQNDLATSLASDAGAGIVDANALYDEDDIDDFTFDDTHPNVDTCYVINSLILTEIDSLQAPVAESDSSSDSSSSSSSGGYSPTYQPTQND
ncbi:hypothetical protein CTAYLR_001999 [Chrysophaeum taylorii]|uniref:Kinesin motor domain-containing protein n=1 Tax=Chrysophaeum taylorii TaxID=2483200 RepID=A0AAD7U9D1_9STRA|nr:hypothetical protein CTAYLR_001999 [Chrysophaeum taylorii]